MAAFFCGLVATPGARLVALKYGVTDDPSNRKLHTVPVPYLGGVAVALSVLLVAWSFGGTLPLQVTGLGLCLAGLGLWDDLFPMEWRPKLGIEMIAAILAATLIVSDTHDVVSVYGLMLVAIGAGAITLMSNSFNLIDNMDGHLGLVVVASAVPLALLASDPDSTTGWLPLPAALGGACAAFLLFNLAPSKLAPRMRIFLGDSGSLMLGFLVTTVAFVLVVDRPLPALVSSLVLFVIVPVADTTTVVIDRVRHGIPIFTPGKDHLSHRLASKLTQRRAIVALGLLQFVSALLAVFLDGVEAGPEAWLSLAVPIAVVVCVVFLALRVDPYESSSTR